MGRLPALARFTSLLFRESFVTTDMMRLKRRYAVVTVAVLVLVVGASTANAHDHRPPRPPVLATGQLTQRGQPVHETWLSRYDDRFCEFGEGWGFMTFPDGIPHRRDTTAQITLRKQSPPREWALEAWSRIRKDGTPKGPAVPVPAVLVPVSRRTGATPQAWKLVFVPPSHKRHVYLAAEIWWADEEGCSLSQVDMGSQSAQWTYHLRVK